MINQSLTDFMNMDSARDILFMTLVDHDYTQSKLTSIYMHAKHSMEEIVIHFIVDWIRRDTNSIKVRFCDQTNVSLEIYTTEGNVQRVGMKWRDLE
jgi:sulfatase maturation enzyme AslB (radical SAM superfamily)